VPRRRFRHARHARRILKRRLALPGPVWLPVLAVGCVLVVCLGVGWLLVGPSLYTTLFPPDSPPQAPASQGAPPPEVPQLGPGVGIGLPQEASPFAGITQPPPPPARRTGTLTYVVRPGDVIWHVAELFQLRPETLLWANDLDDPDLILVGQKLTVPPADGVLYTVRPGDYLADVVNRYGVDLAATVEANTLADPNQLTAGSDIFLPGGRPINPSPNTAQQAEGEAPIPDNIDQLRAAAWLQTANPTAFYRASRGSAALGDLGPGIRLERLDGFENGRFEVRDPGDGRTRQAMTGWVKAIDTAVGRAPSSRELPLSYPADAAMDIAQVFAPYRSQLDGSAYAAANCGPTAIGMALNAFGVDIAPAQLRSETLNNQHMWGNHTGTLITALADTVQQHGLQALDLSEEDGSIHRWTVDEVRAQVEALHPVVVQVRYRNLPGRGGAPYYGDHYITVTGAVPGGFLYNDPIDHDGVGWDRVISDERLTAAMDAADRRYVQAAFAVAP
jgi:LysM repeat protein